MIFKAFRFGNCVVEDASALIAETLAIPKPENSWVSFILSGIFFRSAWKYRKRAFRYVMLDTGHLVENLVSALAYVAGLSVFGTL